MFKRLLQAATITFVLHLLAQTSPTHTTEPLAVSSAREVPKILVGLR